MRRRRVKLWHAESSGAAMKLVSGPRHLDGQALFVYWVPISLAADVVTLDPERAGDWPTVELTLPAWFIARQRLEKYAA